MNTQHTPAPWTINTESWLIGPNKHHVVRVGSATRADARLIAAAPDLLAALRGLLENSGHLGPFGAKMSVANVRKAAKYMRAVEAAEAAIAKAEGLSRDADGVIIAEGRS
jgi:hypothetical protein